RDLLPPGGFLGGRGLLEESPGRQGQGSFVSFRVPPLKCGGGRARFSGEMGGGEPPDLGLVFWIPKGLILKRAIDPLLKTTLYARARLSPMRTAGPTEIGSQGRRWFSPSSRQAEPCPCPCPCRRSRPR